MATSCECFWTKIIGKPYSGKLNVRFDEGELEIGSPTTTPALYSTVTNLIRLIFKTRGTVQEELENIITGKTHTAYKLKLTLELTLTDRSDAIFYIFSSVFLTPAGFYLPFSRQGRHSGLITRKAKGRRLSEKTTPLPSELQCSYNLTAIPFALRNSFASFTVCSL